MDGGLVLWPQSVLYYKAVVSFASGCCERGLMLLFAVVELDSQAAGSRQEK